MNLWNRIDRYIFFLFVSHFLGGLLIFTTLFFTVDFMSLLVNYRGISIATLMHYYVYTLPEILNRMTPMGGVVGTVFTLSLLNRNNEIIALHSLGIGLKRILLPILGGALLLVGLLFFLGNRVIPTTSQKKNLILSHDIKKNPSLFSMIKTNKIWYRSKDHLFYIKSLNEKTNTAQGLTLYYFDPQWNLSQMITSDDVTLSGKTWILHNGSVTVFTSPSSFPLTGEFKEKTILMDEDTQDLAASASPSEALSLQDLFQYIKKNRDAGLYTLQYEIDFHSKIAHILSVIVMILLAIPFSLGNLRSGGMIMNLGMTIGLIFIYWIFLSSSLALGKHGYLPPLLAGWIPNMAMLSLALITLKQKRLL